LPKGERQPDPESVAATASNTGNITLLYVAMIVNVVRRCNWFSDTETGYTRAAGNLGLCDKSPGKAGTTMNTGAIIGIKEAAQRGSIRGATAQKAVGAASG
jgi:glyoxylate carboligase